MILREIVLDHRAKRNVCHRCDKPGHIAAFCTAELAAAPSQSESMEGQGPMSKPFQFLHIAIMREYLDNEFNPKKGGPRTSFGYDLERVIDDFVFSEC